MSIIKKVEFHNSVVYDFLASIFRFNCNEKLFSPNSQDALKEKIKSTEDILRWVKDTDKKIPKNIKVEIHKFFNWETFYGMCLVPLVYTSKSTDVLEFIEYLEKLKPIDFFERFLSTGYGPTDGEVSKDKINRLLKDKEEAMEFINNKMSIPSQHKWELLQFFRNPHQMKRDFINLLRWYYDNIYSKEMDRVEEITKKYMKKLEEKLMKYGEEYLELLTKVNYNKDKTVEKIIISISYYYEFSSLNSSFNNNDLHMFGYRHTEVFVEDKHSILSNVQMFKALADETRINIIKLLSQKSMYGHELSKELDLSNSTISYHISMLTFNGFVEVRRVENRNYLSLNVDKMKKIINDSIDKMLN